MCQAKKQFEIGKLAVHALRSFSQVELRHRQLSRNLVLPSPSSAVTRSALSHNMTRPNRLQAFILPTTMKITPQRGRRASATPRFARYETPFTTNRRAFLSVLAAVPLSLIARKCEASIITEALVELKAAEGALDRLELLADADEYEELRRYLRSAPLNRIRTACSTLYRSMPDEARRKQAESAYKKLIRSVEETDVKALRVSRGEIKADLSQSVHQVQQLFNDFSVLVEE